MFLNECLFYSYTFILFPWGRDFGSRVDYAVNSSPDKIRFYGFILNQIAIHPWNIKVFWTGGSYKYLTWRSSSTVWNSITDYSSTLWNSLLTILKKKIWKQGVSLFLIIRVRPNGVVGALAIGFNCLWSWIRELFLIVVWLCFHSKM